MKALSKTALVAILFCIGGHHAQGEPDYSLPGGPPPTSPTILLEHSGKPLQPPTLLSPVSSLRSHRPRTKIVEHYLSSEFTVFGGGPPLPPPPPNRPFFRFRHPNSIFRDPPQKPFEVVRAPVIYHQTVTDTDVTKALADAFDVVEKLRKPGNKIKALPQDDTPSTFTNVEFVSHVLPQSLGNTATTTTTIVEAPQHLNAGNQNSNRHHHHQSQAVTLGQVTLVSNNQDQQQEQNLPPLPAAADLPPPPQRSSSGRSTSAPVLESVEVIPVLPPTTTSTSPAPRASPKLLIPSQPHVTTLQEAVQSVDPQLRTIIQPVYIPYAVDQNGRPVGPLPDYHSMDFRLLLSAQKQILDAASAAMRASVPVQVVQAQSVSEIQQPQQEQQQFYAQTDQNIAAADVSSGTVPSTSPTRSRKRIARRRNNSARRI